MRQGTGRQVLLDQMMDGADALHGEDDEDAEFSDAVFQGPFSFWCRIEPLPHQTILGQPFQRHGQVVVVLPAQQRFQLGVSFRGSEQAVEDLPVEGVLARDQVIGKPKFDMVWEGPRVDLRVTFLGHTMYIVLTDI